jgi:hypothetical protein
MEGLGHASLTIISNRTCGTARSREWSGQAKIASFAAFRTLLLAFVVALLRALLWFVRSSRALRS